MPVFNDIYQVSLEGNAYGSIIRNIFHFIPSTTPLNKQDAAVALGDEFASAAWLTVMNAIIVTACTWTKIRVTDLKETDVLYDKSISVVGGVGAGSEAVQLAVSFLSAQPAVGVHRAEKRLGPVSSSGFADNVMSGGMVTLCNAIDTLFNSGIDTTTEQGFSGHWSYSLVKRIKSGSGPTATYRLPGPSDFPATAYPTSGWYHNVHPGTQNTRKFGRGE